MDRITEMLHARADTSGARPNVTPQYQCSSFLSDSDYFYTRKGNPNATELEMVLQRLEGCRHVSVVTTGMSAIAMALRLLRPGDHLLVDRLIYGCTYKLFEEFCAHYGIGLDFVDLAAADLSSRVRPNTKMVFFETPTNPFLKTIPIEPVRRAVKAKAPGALLVVDNTWATPYFQRPLDLGADLCVYSATKFYSGHSDCMGGALSTNDDTLAEKLREIRFFGGFILDPHSCWLLRRSLQTFALRMEAHQKTALEMKAFLEAVEEVERVYFPEVGGQLSGYGCILFAELRAELEEKVPSFMKSLRLFERGTSMASVVSGVAQPFTGSHLTLTDEEKAQMGIGRTLVRLCFGLEPVEDLKQDLKMAFRRLHES
jgi:cystathionine gamma-lyase / homocysteine desulfhydrase